MRTKTVSVVALLLVIFLLASPVFFDIYRITAFNAIPNDGYPNYVLYLLGRSATTPTSPSVYRVGSVAVILPFYYALPTYRFTNLEGVSPEWMRAAEAVSFVSYLSLVLTSLMIFLIVRKRYGGSVAAATILGFVSFFLSGFMARVGVDALAVLLICLLVYWLETPLLFAPLVLLSAGFNEKIPIIFAILFFVRFATAVFGRRPFRWYAQLISSWLAVVVYFVVRLAIWRVPGWESEAQPWTYLESLLHSLSVNFSAKGAVLTLIPLVLLVIMAALALRAPRRGPFQASDVWCLAGFTLVALFADTGISVGRLAMYCYPLYLPAVAPLLDDALARWDSPAEKAPGPVE